MEIHIVFIELHPEAENIRRQFDQIVSTIKRYLTAITSESERLFDTLFGEIRGLILQRRKELERAGQIAKDLGYPLRRRDDSQRIVVPLVRKRIVIGVPVGSPKPVVQEPYLEDAIYGEILDVLASMSLLLERSPATFAHLAEEIIRDLFLLQLNGQFEGKATGETFNAAGKTDILLREQDKNIFIAECKFWNGPKSLVDAVDQVLSYLTWRDSKTAVLVFSRRKDFSRTVEEAQKTLHTHSQFRQVLACERQTSFRARMARRDDEDRRIDLTVMMFNIPSRE
jgi:hypothetical protein